MAVASTRPVASPEAEGANINVDATGALPRTLVRTGEPFRDLVALMARLRTPVDGCPWDLEQTFQTIAPYTIEEAYEVADAIERGSMEDLRGELGDLLFQSVFHARMAEEAGAFAIDDVLNGLIDKMIERHPHVFGEVQVATADAQTEAWERMKAAERAKRAVDGPESALDGVALALPSLLRAEKLTKRAARVGFDWPDVAAVLDKLDEERGELSAALAAGDPINAEEELGDMLFVMANLARKLKVDPEAALKAANAKFERRFKAMEALARGRGIEFGAQSLEAQEALWLEVKTAERG